MNRFGPRISHDNVLSLVQYTVESPQERISHKGAIFALFVCILPRQPHTDLHLCFALAHLDQAEWSCSFTLQHVNRHHNKLFPVATTAPAVQQHRSSLNCSSLQRRSHRWKTGASLDYLNLALSYFLKAASAVLFCFFDFEI